MRTFDSLTKRAYPAKDWSQAHIPPVVSREEATFWLYAISGIGNARIELGEGRGVGTQHETARAFARAELEQLDLSQQPDHSTIARRLAAAARQTWGGGSYAEIVIALAAFLDVPALLEMIVDEANEGAVSLAEAEAVRAQAALAVNSGWNVSVVTIFYPESTPVPEGTPVEVNVPPQGPILPDVAPELPITAETPFAILCERMPRSDWAFAVQKRAWLLHSLAAGFANYVAPYLEREPFEHARAIVLPSIHRALKQPIFTGPQYYRAISFSPAFYLAASLRHTEEVAAIVAAWSGHVQIAQSLPFLPTIVYGLPRAEAIVEESRHLAIALAEPAALREWLATTGETGLEYAFDQLALHATESTADAFVDAVAALEVPAVAPAMLRLTTIPVLYVSARSWLESHFDHALPTLASALHRTSAVSATSSEILHRFARRGHPAAVEALAAKEHSA